MTHLRWRLAAVLLTAGLAAATPAHATDDLDAGLLARALDRAAAMPRLHALIVARHGRVQVERAFRGSDLDRAVNVKSVSKSVIAALVGIAIGKGVLKGADEPMAAYLADRFPAKPDPRLGQVTVRHLLSMTAGLERTSGPNYGRWVMSPDWVRHALARPFVDAPGGAMRYSTGDWHLLSAVLTRAAGQSTHALAEAWLGKPLGIRIPAWQRDPQGIFFGGNNMALSPRALLAFGELYRNDGVRQGRRVLPEGWVATSWTSRGTSPFSGDDYGYGWFLTEMCGERVAYARGFGGQFIYVAPESALTVVITSDQATRTRVGGYREALISLVGDELIPAARQADGKSC